MMRTLLVFSLLPMLMADDPTSNAEQLEAVIAVVTHSPNGEGNYNTNHHDAYIYLMRHGNKESVPYLIEDLLEVEQILEKNKKKRKKKRRIECTWIHLRDALKAQTGKDFGFDRKAWEQWWADEGRHLPGAYFSPIKNKPMENHAIESIGANSADS